MNQINIIPKIMSGKFACRVLMDNYDMSTPMVIAVTARRNDGEYQTRVLTYPDPEVDYGENLRLVFFDIGRSHVCQLTSVFINGHEVRTYYSDVEGLTDTQARYDDSLCRIERGARMGKVNLSFQVLETRDPKVLQILDESEWGLLAERKAIIDITCPGMEEPVTFFLGKNQVNTFTSMTLGLNCLDYDKGPVYLDLPDGIYKIKITGSPSAYTFSRDYLKTDLTRRMIDRLWIKTNVLCDERDNELVDKIREIELLMMVAEANVRLGNTEEAHSVFDRVTDLLELASGCLDC